MSIYKLDALVEEVRNHASYMPDFSAHIPTSTQTRDVIQALIDLDYLGTDNNLEVVGRADIYNEALDTQLARIKELEEKLADAKFKLTVSECATEVARQDLDNVLRKLADAEIEK